MGWPEEGASGKGKQELSVGSKGDSAPRFNSAQEGRQSSTRGSCAHLTHLPHQLWEAPRGREWLWHPSLETAGEHPNKSPDRSGWLWVSNNSLP